LGCFGVGARGAGAGGRGSSGCFCVALARPGPLVGVRCLALGGRARSPLLVMGQKPKRAPLRGDHGSERTVAWRCIWPSTSQFVCALAAWRPMDSQPGRNTTTAARASAERRYMNAGGRDNAAACALLYKTPRWPGHNSTAARATTESRHQPHTRRQPGRNTHCGGTRLYRGPQRPPGRNCTSVRAAL
jgi:hypothetical protein